jgi:hypothetical protein
MNEHKPNLYQLRALLDDLRRLDRAVQVRGNQMVLVTEDIEDTIPDEPIPD